MASKGRESWDKRQRERTKKDRQAAKRAERAERRSSENEIVEMSIYLHDNDKKTLQVISDRARPFVK